MKKITQLFGVSSHIALDVSSALEKFHLLELNYNLYQFSRETHVERFLSFHYVKFWHRGSSLELPLLEIK